ncbi:MAG: alpha-ketoglutarate-dependent dioxygenase AlkB [Actinoallomurus sp.]
MTPLPDIPPSDHGPIEVAPGAVHLPRWLDLDTQRRIVDEFQQWATGPVPIRAAKVRGHEMTVRTVCLGWHWQPYQYTREATDVNGARVLPVPDWLADLGRRALLDTGNRPAQGAAYAPDAVLVNYYDTDARLGMHQDRDEQSMAPGVSLSIGDECTFRFGNTENRGRTGRHPCRRHGAAERLLRSADPAELPARQRLPYVSGVHHHARVSPPTQDPAHADRAAHRPRRTGRPGPRGGDEPADRRQPQQHHHRSRRQRRRFEMPRGA